MAQVKVKDQNYKSKYRHAILDGDKLLTIVGDMDEAIQYIHEYEQMELVMHNRLTICDIVSRKVHVLQ